jgi:hypothetical protein
MSLPISPTAIPRQPLVFLFLYIWLFSAFHINRIIYIFCFVTGFFHIMIFKIHPFCLLYFNNDWILFHYMDMPCYIYLSIFSL